MERPDPNQLAALVSKSAFFNAVPMYRIVEILPKLTYFTLPPENVLFHQGAPSDAIYILLKGSLIAYFLTSSGEPTVVGSIEPYETIGELGVLSSEPRSLTVKTVSECDLIEISSALFKKLCEEFPGILFHIIQPVIARSLNTIKLLQTEKKPENYIFFPAERNLNLANLKNKIGDCIKKLPDSKVKMDFVEAGFFDPFEKLDQNEDFLYINFINESIDPYSLQKIVVKSKNFYLVADGTKPMKIDGFAQKILDIATADSSVKLNLVLLYPNHMTGFPVHTSEWLEKYNFFLYQHIKEESDADYQRLFRFLNQKPVGLVFGGGGARGVAHLGVLKALIQKKIPIDIVGGTSIGGLVAALYAWTQNYEETENYFLWILDKCYEVLFLRNLTWPLTSLYSADPVTRATQHLFHDFQIENLWLPFFCISSNLSSRHEAVHNKGLLWEKVRATASTPGLVPPVVMEGDLHVDGGLLNNLPVDVMRYFIGPSGIIIASKLSNAEADKKHYRFPPSLTLKDAILYKSHIGHKDYSFPPLFEILMNSLLLGSSQKEDNNAYAANILINPSLEKYRTLTRKRVDEERLINLGYEETMRILEFRSNMVFNK